MTSQGHAYSRFRVAIDNPKSILIIRTAIAELPGPVPLADALGVCLAFLELEPATFDPAAARWVGRLILERRLGIADAQLALAAIAALSKGERRAGAEALICLCERYNLRGGERILPRGSHVTAWRSSRG